MPIAFIMPKFDMDQEKATIVSWSKAEGDFVKADESVLVVETEKVAIEVPAPATGTLVGICRHPGDVVPVTEVIAYILKPGETLADLPQLISPPPVVEAPGVKSQPAQPLSPPTAGEGPGVRAQTATPVALRMLKELGLELSQVPAAAERLTREDIERYLESRASFPPPPAGEGPGVRSETGRVKHAATPAARRVSHETGVPLEGIPGSGPRGRIQAANVLAARPQTAAVTASRTDPTPARRIPLTGIRQTIANRMSASFHDIPHIALTVEADVTALEAARGQLNTLAARQDAGKISLTALLIKIVAWALQRNPYINASILNGEIHLWEDANIGIATALDEGLIVPVIHRTQALGVAQIAAALQDVTGRAREGRLELADVQRGTFTISNLGMFGIRQFRAIINPPESAILAVGAVVRKPVVINDRDELAVRPIMSLTLSADHRVIDGVTAARFLADLISGIEAPANLLY